VKEFLKYIVEGIMFLFLDFLQREDPQDCDYCVVAEPPVGTFSQTIGPLCTETLLTGTVCMKNLIGKAEGNHKIPWNFHVSA
jgi:hypothetical protein